MIHPKYHQEVSTHFICLPYIFQIYTKFFHIMMHIEELIHKYFRAYILPDERFWTDYLMLWILHNKRCDYSLQLSNHALCLSAGLYKLKLRNFLKYTMLGYKNYVFSINFAPRGIAYRLWLKWYFAWVTPWIIPLNQNYYLVDIKELLITFMNIFIKVLWTHQNSICLRQTFL